MCVVCKLKMVDKDKKLKTNLYKNKTYQCISFRFGYISIIETITTITATARSTARSTAIITTGVFNFEFFVVGSSSSSSSSSCMRRRRHNNRGVTTTTTTTTRRSSSSSSSNSCCRHLGYYKSGLFLSCFLSFFLRFLLLLLLNECQKVLSNRSFQIESVSGSRVWGVFVFESLLFFMLLVSFLSLSSSSSFF